MTSPQVLVYRNDGLLDDEIRQAVAHAPNRSPVLHFHSDLRGTIASARNFQPALVLLEIGNDFETLKSLIDECIAAAPDARIGGIYDVAQLPSSISESALMMRALRLGVEDFLRRPVAGTEFEQVLRRCLSPRRRIHSTNGRLVSFISNKGGVGKSTASVNVAVELATRHPDRVALIDGSLQMGVCATQLNVNPDTTLVDAWQQRERLDERLLTELMCVHDSGLHLLAAPNNAIDAAEIDDSFLSRVLLLARRSYDFVIIDTFPLFDRTVMAVLDLCDQSVIVVENVVPTLQTVRGFFSLLKEVEFPITRQKLLLNRYSTRAGGPSATEVSRYLGRVPDYVVPHDRRVVLAANTGIPFVLQAGRWNKAAVAIRMIADDLEASILPERSPSDSDPAEHPPQYSENTHSILQRNGGTEA